MRRHDFTPLFLMLALILGLALFWACRASAHITPEDDARLEAAAAAVLSAYNAIQDVRQEGGQVPPPPVSDKQDWQCYLDRYDDVRRNGAYTAGWANRHYANWGQREGRVWGCTQIVDPRPPSTGASAPILWKPVSESRGGRLVILLPATWSRPGSVMVNTETCGYVDVDGHNGGRHHYWCSKPGSAYPQNTVLTANGKRYLVPSPGQRYESLREASAKLPWHHSNQSGSFGTSVNLCEQYDARKVSLNGAEWIYHRRDKGREVWYDAQQRDGMSGTITVELESGEVITAELTPGSGIRYSGDC